MISEPDLMGESKGPPSKRARLDSPLETPNTDTGNIHSLFFSFFLQLN